MDKFITFILNSKNVDHIFENSTICYSHNETEQAINENKDDICTYDLSFLSFDLLEKGYTIMIEYNNNFLTCYPGMKTLGKKRITKKTNLIKLINEGYFKADLKIE